MLAAVYAVGVHITVGRLSVRPSVSRPSVCPVDRQHTKSADFVGLSETRADPADFVWSGPVGPVWWNLAITGRLWIVAGTRAMLSSDWHRHRLIISQKNIGLMPVSSHLGGSVAEWLVCWTQAQKGRESNRSRDAVG